MGVIDIDKLLAEAKQPKPAPVVTVVKIQKGLAAEETAENLAGFEENLPVFESKASILSDLSQHERDIHIERNKLSNYYHELDRIQAPKSAYADNYGKIEEFTIELQRLYDLKRYVMRYGKLPDRFKVDNPEKTESLAQMKEQRRSLNNRKSKWKNKLKLAAKYPEGSPQYMEIMLEIEKLEAEQHAVNDKISKIENKY